MMIGHEIQYFPSVTSTNDLAWELAGDDARHGTVIHADFQSQGRGQRGNQWMAPAGSSLMMSVLLRHHEALEQSHYYTLWAATSVAQLVQKLTKLQPRLKWPNDTLLLERKVSGVLTERRGDWTVTGIGLNLTIPRHFFEQQRVNAISLQEVTQALPDQKIVLKELLAIMNTNYQAIMNSDTASLMLQWRTFTGLQNKQVQLVSGGQKYHGELQYIDWNQCTLNSEKGSLSFHPASITAINLHY